MQEHNVSKEVQIDEKFAEYKKTRDISLRNELVEDHLFMVDILIRKYTGKGIERDDLYQVGALALIKAVERFDPDKGFKFSSFATPTILGEIRKYFRDRGWSVRVPRSLKENAVALPGVKDELTSELGRVPTVAEIAERMSISEGDVLEAMESSMAYDAFSLNMTYDEDGGSGDAEILQKATATDEEGYERLENYEIIDSVLSRLSGTDRYIFRQRIYEERSQADIAEELGVSQMTISRVERKIKEKFAAELAK
jgi:RNA polymerase sigma-B factor